jgi:hypothetical protein
MLSGAAHARRGSPILGIERLGGALRKLRMFAQPNRVITNRRST